MKSIFQPGQSIWKRLWEGLDQTHDTKHFRIRYSTTGKNAVPGDPRSPFITSGLRVGTPAITTRGFGEAETVELTGWMCDVLESLENETSEQVIAEVKAKVLDICGRFPVYK